MRSLVLMSAFAISMAAVVPSHALTVGRGLEAPPAVLLVKMKKKKMKMKKMMPMQRSMSPSMNNGTSGNTTTMSGSSGMSNRDGGRGPGTR